MSNGFEPPPTAGTDTSTLEFVVSDFTALAQRVDAIEGEINVLVSAETVLAAEAFDGLGTLRSIAHAISGALRRALSALTHLSISRLWAKLKEFYRRFRRLLELYRKYIQDPMDRLRRQLDAIYRTIFRPIIQILDALRLPLRILAIFNRKLAAKLDQRLFGLERAILAPLLTIYQRLNALSSTVRGTLTQAGFLDRVTLVESIRRDASLILDVLTNPRGAIAGQPSPPGVTSLHEIDQNYRLYLSTGTGPVADAVQAMDLRYQSAQLEVA